MDGFAAVEEGMGDALSLSRITSLIASKSTRQRFLGGMSGVMMAVAGHGTEEEERVSQLLLLLASDAGSVVAGGVVVAVCLSMVE